MPNLDTVFQQVLDYSYGLIQDASDIFTIKNIGERNLALIKEIETGPYKNHKVAGVCAGCGAMMSIPLIRLLKRHDIICSDKKCKHKHSLEDINFNN